jgi:Cu2+-exporting ATPase
MDEHTDHSAHGKGHEPSIPGKHSEAHPKPEGHHAAHHDHTAGQGQSPHVSDGVHHGHSGHTDHTGHEQMFRRRFWICLALSIPVLIYSPSIQNWLGFSMPVFPGSEWVAPIFGVVVFFYGGVPFLRMAVPELQNRRPGMMTLISLAISVAFIYSLLALFITGGETFFWELVTLIVIMLLGHWLEMRSIRQASGALSELAQLMPDTAERVGSDGEVEVIPSSQLKNGDLVLVRPGASSPADGTVESGSSTVNEAMITGESRPVKKSPGDTIIGGTINGQGSLRVQVTATGDDTALAGIMRLVAQAQASQSDTQVLADRAAGWLFYIAIVVAGLTAVAWSLAIGLQAEMVARVATVLVIACPHALGLAIPLVVAISTALGANNGILVRNRIALEDVRTIDTVIFDKTGTLTEGRFGVVGMAVHGEWTEDGALALAAAIERDSEHTIAQGIRASADKKGLSLPDISDFKAIRGQGVQAIHTGETYYVGGPRLLDGLGFVLPEPLEQFTQTASRAGQSVVYLIEADQVAAGFALADVLRPDSRPAVNQLQEMNIQVVMLTGDSQAVASSVARELGIRTFYAEVLPEHKDQQIAELQKQGRRVAMVGDGINDAPALTRADVGIAIGGGTDVAIESADIILVKSNPMDVVKIFNLSRASYRKMVQNLWWATGYNVIALPLAAGLLAPFGILLSPALGALFMSLSTVIVAVNAQLLRRAQLA